MRSGQMQTGSGRGSHSAGSAQVGMWKIGGRGVSSSARWVRKVRERRLGSVEDLRSVDQAGGSKLTL